MNPDLPLIEIRDWGRPPRRLTLDAPLTVGRDCDGHNLNDREVSRAHVRLVPSPTALSAVDLGSRNGTTLNGVAMIGRASLAAGDVLRLGHSEVVVLAVPTPRGSDQPTVSQDHDATAMFARVAAQPPPPPPSDSTPRRSMAVAVAERLLDIDPTGSRDLFPPSTDLPRVVGLRVWQALRALSVLAYCALIATLFVYPAAGLFVFFGVIVPLLPALFLTAPGLWRNICPLAATNQIPRLFGFSRAISPPDWLRNRGYLIAMALFFGIAGARLAGLDSSGAATGIVLALVAVAAFTGGVLFAGKSGWCSSICPLFPLQRAYGQTPYVTVANSHCPTCVGCAKNCYDFSPRAAYQADLVDADHSWTAARKLFVAALPGFILGFFTLVPRADLAAFEKYPLLGLFVLVSVGTFYAVEAVTPLSQAMVAIVYAAAALNIFYWFAGHTVASSFTEITGVAAPWLHWVFTVGIALLTVLWIARTRVRELQFAWTSGLRAEPVLLNSPKVVVHADAATGPRVRFGDGEAMPAEPGASVLELAESAGVTIEAGCRMGVCGADPVAIVDGADGLAAAEKDELNTLRRLGFGASTRMACCARVNSGTVTVSLTPEPGDGAGQRPARYDRSIVSVVVIGGGIAGVTAADFVRRGHPDCEIHLVGDESHALYNRMGISRLVYGRSAMQGLYLLPDQWYDDHGVHPWLNTIARRIEVQARRVVLGTGEALPFDRLILAMGSRATVPPVGGIGRPGSFVLRQAGDAIGLRGYVQQHGCRRAVVAGGGLLGLEAAYSLHLLGLQVSVLERGERLLHRHIDPRCSELVAKHFVDAGIEVLYSSETDHLDGDPAVRVAVLKNGRRVPCDVFVAATGITPNIQLAREAGIPVRKGVLVDDMMRTRTPGVYAAGDVAEHTGQVLGLWPVAVEQAETAAVNALGGSRVIHSDVPATILKGVGLELFSIGRAKREPSDLVITVEQPRVPSYRRLVLSDMKVVAATILGHHPADVAAATRAVHRGAVLSPHSLQALRAGDWSALTAATA